MYFFRIIYVIIPSNISKMKSSNYFRLCILTFVIISAGCSKSDVSPATKEFKFKTEPWEVNPYWGGPGEDSAWYSWSPEMPGFAVDIISVKVKEKDGTERKAKLYFDLVESGYQYQTGVTDYKLLFWWVQKLPLTKPDADSIFVVFRTR
jgi:hypothetical protein